MEPEAFLRRYFDVRVTNVQDLEEAGFLLRELHIAAEALVSVGSLSEQKAEDILAEFRDRLDTDDHDGVFVGPRTPLGTVEEVGPYGWGDPFFRPTAVPPSLLRVIPVAEMGVIDSFRITVISLELWSEHITLRTMVTAETDPPLRAFLWTWTVQDDQGGLYRRGGGQSGGSGFNYVSELDFHPAVDPAATALILRARRIRPIEAVDPARMTSVSGIPAEELLRFEVALS